MKKLILFSGLLLAGLTMNAQSATKQTANPQQQQQSEDPAVKATKQTERINQQLSLTADQKTKIYNINLEKNKALAAAKQKDGSDQQAFANDHKIIRTQRENEIKAVLTADQQAKWVKYKQDQRSKKGADDEK